MKWMLAAILVCGTSVLTSCSPDNDDNPVAPTDEVEAQLQKMTLREKVGQLFYVRPECLDTTIHFHQPSSVDGSTDDIKAIKLQAVNATMKGVNEKYPVGGVILYAHNIEDEAQLSAFISQIRTLNGSPLLCIDEEGGRVARIANNANFEVEKFESMGAIGATGDPQNAYYCKAKVSSGMNRETAYIAHVFGFALPKLKSSVVAQTRLILTDHTDYAQCVEGAREAVVVQKIDHHVEGDIADSGIPFVRRDMVGSTNTIIYEMYKEQGIAIDDETARIMLAGIISDTRNLSKTTTRAIDSTALQALTAQLAISPDSVARLNRGMEDAATDYTGMTDAEIFLSDY